MKTEKFLEKIPVCLLTTSLIFGLSPVSPASAAKCTAKEIKSLKAVDWEMALASISGDLTDLFLEIEKAKKATKNKSLRAFYSKLEVAVEEDGGVLKYGPSRKMWQALQSKYQYSRC